MNYPRIALAGLGATLAYFAIGFLLFAIIPLGDEIRQYAAVFRPEESMMEAAPVGMGSLVVAMFALATLYSLVHREGPTVTQGVRFGLLVGVFTAGSFILHNYVSLNISLRLALLQALAYFIQWVGSGVVIAIIYRPKQ